MKLEAVFLDRDGVLNPHIPGSYRLSATKSMLPHGDGHVRMPLTVSGDQNDEKLEEAVRRIEKNIFTNWN